MDWFWHALVICLIVIPVTVLWLAIIIELFRRRDLSRVARVLWLLFVLVFPLIGSLTYVIVTWLRAEGKHDLGEAPAAPGVPAEPSTVSDLARLDELRRSGALTEEEFEQGKRRVLEGGDAPTGRHAATEVGS